MMKNRKGFTLIELIVTIAILGAVFVAASYELTSVLENSRKKESLGYLEDIMDSASVYLAMTKAEITTIEQTVTLGEIISSGLIADSITNVNNSLNDNCINFNDNTLIYYKLEENTKKIYMKSETNKCYLDKIEDCKEIIGDC